MKLKKLDYDLSVCRLKEMPTIEPETEFFFLGKTDEEISLVCRKEDIPYEVQKREDGWRGFRIEGVLDFSMIGVLASIAGILAEQDISIFAVSTYNTDYILVKEESYERAMKVLEEAGYTVL